MTPADEPSSLAESTARPVAVFDRVKQLPVSVFTGGVLFLLCLALQFHLLGRIFSISDSTMQIAWWLAVHVVASIGTAFSVALIADVMLDSSSDDYHKEKQSRLHPVAGLGILTLCTALAVPIVGGPGIVVALLTGIWFANSRESEDIYWHVTDNIDLPFVTPIGRKVAAYDSRGFLEQLIYSEDTDDLYKKILAASNIKASLSVPLLKQAVGHPDDKIRLTAYQTLDSKATGLNREIQRLEVTARNQEGHDKANTWLQIASNYWELLTLEKGEAVTRKQLLKKAAAAARKAIDIQPTNRNAHFTLGRTALMQHELETADDAFQQAAALGMPSEKILPYLAEVSFNKRDFPRVVKYLSNVEDAFKVYPPLSQVAGYWQAQQPARGVAS